MTQLVAKDRRFIKMNEWEDVNQWTESEVVDVARMSKCLEDREFSAEFRDIYHSWKSYSEIYLSEWTEFLGDESIDSLLFFLTQPYVKPGA